MIDKTQKLDNKALIKLFDGLDTAGVSDAIDKLDIAGQVVGIKPLVDYNKVTVGTAFTVKYVSAGIPAGTVGDYIDDVQPENIIVIDNDARIDCTVWGDILTQYAGIRKIAGTVINGVCRDVNKAISDNYPLFSIGRFMRTGKDRVEVESVNSTISIGQVRVEPNDIIVADANGVIVVPNKFAAKVAQTAHNIEAVESKIRQSIEAGMSISEARKKLDYHSLQRKQDND